MAGPLAISGVTSINCSQLNQFLPINFCTLRRPAFNFSTSDNNLS